MTIAGAEINGLQPTRDCGIDAETFARLAQEYQSRWTVQVAACRPDGVLVLGDGPADAETCAARELALREALRWGEPTFALTVGDDLLWAVPCLCNAQLRGGLAAWLPAAQAAGRDLTRAAADLRRLAEAANVTNAALLEAARLAQGRERRRAEAIHALKGAPPYGLRQMYLLEEPALAAAVRRGDRGEARNILNRLLVGIHAGAGERLDLIKSFYAELVVTVSRTAVWAGGAPEEILPANLSGLARLALIDDPRELAHWLREMLEQAMDGVRVSRRRDDGGGLADAVRYLHEHCGEPLSRDEVAKVACLSPSHFSREIKRRLGRTFTALLTRIRVEHAAELLARTDKPVGLVALECGFGDQSYFTKVFRRAAGLTPRAYRAAGAAADVTFESNATSREPLQLQ
jgi:AraC-like DNA-binding protein